MGSRVPSRRPDTDPLTLRPSRDGTGRTEDFQARPEAVVGVDVDPPAHEDLPGRPGVVVAEEEDRVTPTSVHVGDLGPGRATRGIN